MIARNHTAKANAKLHLKELRAEAQAIVKLLDCFTAEDVEPFVPSPQPISDDQREWMRCRLGEIVGLAERVRETLDLEEL